MMVIAGKVEAARSKTSRADRLASASSLGRWASVLLDSRILTNPPFGCSRSLLFTWIAARRNSSCPTLNCASLPKVVPLRQDDRELTLCVGRFSMGRFRCVTNKFSSTQNRVDSRQQVTLGKCLINVTLSALDQSCLHHIQQIVGA
jgi:hypothetical protein